MANARSRAVHKQNTAVLYYEPSDHEDDAPVSTARIVSVGGPAAARSSATLQLVGGMVEGVHAEPQATAYAQPQVVQVEPPRAASQRRPGEKRPTRVIAYNVRIVAQGDESEQAKAVGVSGEPFVETPDPAGGRSMDSFDMRGRPHRHYKVPNLSPQGAVHAQFVMPNRAPDGPHTMPFEARSARVEASSPAPRQARSLTPRAAHFDRPAQADVRFDASHPRAVREPMQFELPGMRNAHGPDAIPMGLFGALGDRGGRLHQPRRDAAQTRASAAAGSYKQLLARYLAQRSGPLLSNRTMCIAVGAYAFILFLLALFTG